MLSRHIIRSKTLQAIYSFIVGGESDLAKGRKSLTDSVEDIRDLVFYQLSALLELRDIAERKAEENKHKHIPSGDDLAPNTRFIENPFLLQLRQNTEISKGISSSRINWADWNDYFRKLYSSVLQWNEYKHYMAMPEPSDEDHQQFVVKLFKKFIAFDGTLKAWYEELNIHWGDDSVLSGLMLHAWLKAYDPNRIETQVFPPLLKKADRIGDDDDRAYMITLFEKTILNFKKYDQLIENHIKNWDLERIITIDMIIIKMAITEITEFQNIPIKASLNEYIELSKEFGTPKSNSFVNGLLDKVIAELKSEGKISKAGRGLA